jgi:hypothetical protein
MSEEIKAGMRILDNDPRMLGRKLTIKELTCRSHVLGKDVQWAICQQDGLFRVTRISVFRIHTDGKPRKSGFSLIRDCEVLPPRFSRPSKPSPQPNPSQPQETEKPE